MIKRSYLCAGLGEAVGLELLLDKAKQLLSGYIKTQSLGNGQLRQQAGQDTHYTALLSLYVDYFINYSRNVTRPSKIFSTFRSARLKLSLCPLRVYSIDRERERESLTRLSIERSSFFRISANELIN